MVQKVNIHMQEVKNKLMRKKNTKGNMKSNMKSQR